MSGLADFVNISTISSTEYSEEEATSIFIQNIGEVLRNLVRVAGQPQELLPDIEEVNSAFAGLDDFSDWLMCLSDHNILTKEEAQFAEESYSSEKALSEEECDKIILAKLGVDNSSCPFLTEEILEEKLAEENLLADKMKALTFTNKHMEDDIVKQKNSLTMLHKNLETLNEKHSALLTACQDLLQEINSKPQGLDFSVFLLNYKPILEFGLESGSLPHDLSNGFRTKLFELFTPLLNQMKTLFKVSQIQRPLFISKENERKLTMHFGKLSEFLLKMKYLLSLKVISQILLANLSIQCDNTSNYISALVRVKDTIVKDSVDTSNTLVEWYTNLAGSEPDICVTVDEFLSLLSSMDLKLETHQSLQIDRMRLLNSKLLLLMSFIKKVQSELRRETSEVHILRLKTILEKIAELSAKINKVNSGIVEGDMRNRVFYFLELSLTDHDRYVSEISDIKTKTSILQKAIDAKKTKPN